MRLSVFLVIVSMLGQSLNNSTKDQRDALANWTYLARVLGSMIPEVTTNLDRWAKAGKINFFIAPQPGPGNQGIIAVIDSTSKLPGLWASPEFLNKQQYPDLRRDTNSKIIELYGAYVLLKAHMDNELSIQNEPSIGNKDEKANEKYAQYIWERDMRMTVAEWTLAKRLRDRDLMPQINSRVNYWLRNVPNEEQALLYAFCEAIIDPSRFGTRSMRPIWQQRCQIEKAKLHTNRSSQPATP